ncbi:MAG: ribose 5-phosphate isomerase B [Deltaproteobacteria bacterium]|nr:ribose 5-phosphate isomerase B [Deltaproteobacteria bacterium]
MEQSTEQKLGIASDHGGFALKQELIPWLKERGLDVVDLGCHGLDSVDYPDLASKLTQGISNGEFARGILICGTGLGMSMAANRHLGIRAALCTSGYTARMARAHNDANVLCMGGRVVGGGLAQDIVDAFLSQDFEGGRHARRIARLDEAVTE